MKKERNSNIEILRIISILFIVISHYTVHNGINSYELPIGINRFILEITELGNIGVIIFVLISGYYLINAQKFKLSKLIKLICQVMFYSISIYFLMVVTGNETFSIRNLLHSVFPITFKEYWFATVYVILYIFSPFLNKLLNNITRQEHFRLILIMMIIFSVLNTLNMCDYYGNEIVQFVMFYAIGAYLSKYPNNILQKNNNNKKLLIISIFVIICSIILLDLLRPKIFELGIPSTYLLSRTSVIAIIFSICLFDVFSRKKIYCNPKINYVSSLVFGVYLIHDNTYIRKILWIDLLKNSNYVYSKGMIIHLVLSVFAVFVICLIIEAIRKKIEKTLFKKLSPKIDSLQEKFNNYICRKID